MTPEQAVKEQAEGIIKWTFSGEPEKVKVLAHSAKPMYLVEDESGRKHWVREDTVFFEEADG